MEKITPAFAGPFRIRDVHYGRREVQPRHSHEQLQISIVLRGRVEEDSGGVRYHGCAGDIIAKPAGRMHANAFDDARIVCLDADPDGLDSPLPGYGWHRTSAMTMTALGLVKRFHRGDAVGDDIDDLLALFPSPHRSDSRLARRASRALEECFTEPISIGAVARELGVHRVYLARIFRQQWGCSPRDYVQRLRVRAAANALASTGRVLAEIAVDSGFNDQPHMSRIFARTTGMTPGTFRRLAQT